MYPDYCADDDDCGVSAGGVVACSLYSAVSSTVMISHMFTLWGAVCKMKHAEINCNIFPHLAKNESFFYNI